MEIEVVVVIVFFLCVFSETKLEIMDMYISPNLTFCDNATVVCKVRPSYGDVWWTFSGKNISEEERYTRKCARDEDIAVCSLHVDCISVNDIGNYTCHMDNSDDYEQDGVERSVFLNLTVPAKVLSARNSVEIAVGKTAELACSIHGYPIEVFDWQKLNGGVEKLSSDVNQINDTLVESKLRLGPVSRKDNGTYRCIAFGSQGEVSKDVHLLVLDKPLVKIDFIKAVGRNRIFMNWTVNDGNQPIQEYFIQHMKNATGSWTYYPEQIGGGNTSYVIRNLDNNTAYEIRLSAKNAMGMGNMNTWQGWVRTLDKDPYFVPEISVKGVTLNSITIGWSQPPEEMRDHVHYYMLIVQNNSTTKEAFHPEQSMNLFLFTDLQAATTYRFKVSACSYYTKQCGNWSKEANGTTMDGESSAPENVSLVCRFDNISHTSFVYVTWTPPIQPNGQIMHYNVILRGEASFKNESGLMQKIYSEPKVKRVEGKQHSTRFDLVPPNTNYTVKVSGVTRSRHQGEEATCHCTMPPTVPDKDKLARFSWRKLEEQGHWLFKLLLPRVTERNGPICCYRVFLVKLEPHQSVADLPAPEDFHVSSYEEVHHSKKGGAYVAEMFESNSLISEVFLGDGQTMHVNSSACDHCIGLRPKLHLHKTTHLPISTTHVPTAATATLPEVSGNMDPPAVSPSVDYFSSTFEPSLEPIRVRRAESTFAPDPVPTLVLPQVPVPSMSPPPPHTSIGPVTQMDIVGGQFPVHDGQLDSNSNYTGFVEVIVFGPEQMLLPAYSGYFMVLKPGLQVLQAAEQSQVLALVLQVLCALILIVLVLLLSLCLLQRYTKQVAEAQGVEMTLTNSFRHLCRSLRGRHVLVSASPPDMTPIAKADLTMAYVERHRDSDYGFQHEFELLPDRFPDRTTRHSEARENAYKNRYPDIKAYDQTRVRLSQVDSVVGSDYINANFVVGYKERKKFICAQGPMDNTVCDFWRMVWEQHLELILMLTNLEEYSKTKCAKYWPDDAEGDKMFGDFGVAHVREKRYSDYIVRELKMWRTCGSGIKDREKEERSIVQYHYLVWKDFMAPEHPAGILKFIRRMNEAYSLEKGPILVHCSAGVGRTGTLVALDSLLQQLAEEGHVAIFNTVCDLRHQRNFLVQSLKQYIFIYRALMEVAQFGDTELKVTELKSAVEKLRQRENGKDRCKMEDDFEKINRVVEDRKSFSVGGGEENRNKNRSELVIPYDRNRVILTPVPGREHSTYINASFIEGYDNSESFIITQDPLESTIADFWRMVSEQSITTLVMLSDLGDGSKKCIRYWPDDEISLEHIHVKYIQSESCPYYTRRELCVTNTKTDENVVVTQFQYNGWPTVEGEVPEVTRGLIELVDQTQNHQEAHGGSGPIAVHCNCGSDRSSMFVALSILVQQLHTEKRVDIFTATRKLRSQRHGMLQTFAQYEFLHRAIVNYADLHHLTEDPA
ncbi:Tyrosine-protein phosphatase 69D [Cryptotermes secundus]|uniref:protein-tyrosine-phosphatase n=1 Tax=Cryptotermes secundus TaxID=105785 RepID=A0A2J7Q3C3_9NEOP|nr:Tyrosine-protein phosphatase 69D [Cryptotermes secundus]